MDKTETVYKTETVLGVIIVAIFAIILGTLFGVALLASYIYVGMTVWNWFMPLAFNLPALTGLQAICAYVMLAFIRMSLEHNGPKETEHTKGIWMLAKMLSVWSFYLFAAVMYVYILPWLFPLGG